MSLSGSDSILLRTPVTKLYKLILPHAISSPRCGHFEYKILECWESYGRRPNDKCNDYLADLYECLGNKKSMMRIEAMQRERDLQYREGRLDKKYMDKPFANIN